MKLRLLILGLIGGLCLQAVAQDGIDVTKLTADTKTFIFDNNKNTVKGYIYAELEERTACCGSDRIYLEVKIDPSGYVLKVNPLTGKNDCLKRSAADIVKNVKWDASSFRAPKSIYFEIKPDVTCEEGKDNVYAQLDVYNNQLLNPEGQQIAGTGAIIRQNDPPKEETQAPPAETNQPKPAESTQPDPKAAETVAANDPSKEEAVTENPVEGTTTRSEPAETITPPSEELATAAPQNPTTQPPAVPNPNPNLQQPDMAKDQAIEDARERAEIDRVAQQQEIQALRDQMAKLREQAEQQRQDKLRREQEEADRMAFNEEQPDRSRRRGPRGRSVKPQEEAGGLFLDDVPETNEQPEEYTDTGEPDPNATEEDRIREEIARLEQQLREVEDDQRAKEDEARRQQEEAERNKVEMFRIKEQIAMKEEEAAQQREAEELRRMEEEQRLVEDERRRKEEEYQRAMDEIKRLQDEADRQIQDLENQRRDIERLAALKKNREQEIVLQQALREAETQRMLEEERLRLTGQAGSGTSTRSLSVAGNDAGVNADITAILQSLDFTNDPDSEKLKELVRIINLLQNQLFEVNTRIQYLESGGDPNPSGSTLPQNNQPNTRSLSDALAAPTDPPKSDKPSIPAGYRTGTSLSLDDIIAPDMKKEDYVIARSVPEPVPPVVNPNTGNPQANNPSNPGQPAQTKVEDRGHKDTYWDGPGPKFEPRVYVEGEAKMKEIIKERLRAGGVCGLGQAAFSLTLDPQGNVKNHSVLAANSAVVEIQLGSVLPTLKFNAVDSRYRQTIYLQFKAEILCEGTQKVELQNVDNIIKN